MTHPKAFAAYDPGELPDVVARYLAAQADDRGGVVDVFAPDARVLDEGIEYFGTEEIRGWLGKAASEYTYTTTFTGQRHVDDNRWEVRARLEGNFPGGTADLRFQFRTEDDRIHDLAIEP